MNQLRDDDETLAALLDGRLTGEARAEALSRLAASGEDYDVFGDTAAVLHEIEAGETEATVAPGDAGTRVIPLASRARPAMRRWLAAAAVLAAVALGATLIGRGARASVTPTDVAARLASADAGLPPGWTERTAWSASRGNGAGTQPADAVRAGALFVDLAVAVQARDVEATRTLAASVGRFDPGTGRGGALDRLATQAGAPPASLTPLVDEAAERVAARLRHDDAMAAGAWTEAARLAADRRDAAFFRGSSTRAGLRSATRAAGEDADARRAMGRVREALDRPGTPDWSALAPALDDLLRVLAGG